MITYFLGTISIFISNELNTEASVEANLTIMKYFGIDGLSQVDELVTVCYFALTTLSTVGYGDYYPISQLEMIQTVVVMLGGVAFFSYIMENFMQIIQQYDEKMGVFDHQEDLNDWIVSLERFTSKTPLNGKFIDILMKDFNFYWANDRVECLNQKDPKFQLLPSSIKQSMMTQYIFTDVFNSNPGFFTKELLNNPNFLEDLCFGLMPRRFLTGDQNDRIIYEDEDQVAEMYFITKGFVAVAINEFRSKLSMGQYEIVKQQKGAQLICDHEAINMKRASCHYLAL